MGWLIFVFQAKDQCNISLCEAVVIYFWLLYMYSAN